MSRSLSSLIILIIFTMLPACSGHSDVQRPDFRPTLEKHLSAVQSRDIAALEATLTKTGGLQVIFPNGARVDNTADVMAFHKEWFDDADWVWTPTIDRIIEGETQASALVTYTMQDTADGPKRASWLFLVFQLEDGAWRLVHDQNTSIPTP